LERIRKVAGGDDAASGVPKYGVRELATAFFAWAVPWQTNARKRGFRTKSGGMAAALHKVLQLK
jgi:hypothetical protein